MDLNRIIHFGIYLSHAAYTYSVFPNIFIMLDRLRHWVWCG